MVYANNFTGATDNDIIEAAISGRGADGIVVIEPRVSETEPERDLWLLDRAVLLPENTTVILRGCTIKLSDHCRDNFFRTANCGIGIEFPEKIKNVYLRGEGRCVLLGADHPRAVGDGSKILANPCPYREEDAIRFADWLSEEKKSGVRALDFMDMHSHSYGTDAGKEGESQYGDWRGIGILFANTESFAIENIHIVDSHGWGISLEACSYGKLSGISFDAKMSKEIDSMLQNMENQDGIDLRNGCHHITISDISGRTGDDLIALTAICSGSYRPGGSMRYTHVMHSDWTKRERDIHDITVSNVCGYSSLCFAFRLLAVESRIYNIILNNLNSVHPKESKQTAAILIGEEWDGAYGKISRDGIRNVIISNVISNSPNAVWVGGWLHDSVISNIVSLTPDSDAIKASHIDSLTNVKLEGIIGRGE